MTRAGRRHALALFAGLVPLVAGVQAPAAATKTPRVGYLGFGTASAQGGWVAEAIHEGMRERGWVEGRNVSSEFRFAERSVERVEEVARELVAARVDVLVALNTTSAHAARKASRSIPIVFATSDPEGLVANLARPEANLTGVTNVASAVAGKQLQILREMAPGAVRVAMLVNPDNPSTPSFRKEAQAAAGTLGMRLAFLQARDAPGLERALAESTRELADALVVQSEALFFFEARRIVSHAAAQRLPAMYPANQFPDAGGLVSYGTDLRALYKQLAAYIDPILRGAKPGQLPVEQAAKFELVINASTAKALGISPTPSLRARADRIIE